MCVCAFEPEPSVHPPTNFTFALTSFFNPCLSRTSRVSTNSLAMRVLIAGSGLSGLVMGHCLLRAGIDDFVILERRPKPVEQSGSVIGTFPQTFRILDQLGLLDDVQKLSPPLTRWLHLDRHGRTISDGDFFACLQAK